VTVTVTVMVTENPTRDAASTRLSGICRPPPSTVETNLWKKGTVHLSLNTSGYCFQGFLEIPSKSAGQGRCKQLTPVTTGTPSVPHCFPFYPTRSGVLRTMPMTISVFHFRLPIFVLLFPPLLSSFQNLELLDWKLRLSEPSAGSTAKEDRERDDTYTFLHNYPTNFLQQLTRSPKSLKHHLSWGTPHPPYITLRHSGSGAGRYTTTSEIPPILKSKKSLCSSHWWRRGRARGVINC
jgi:hypothetical protein